jgi:hypothetical protein
MAALIDSSVLIAAERGQLKLEDISARKIRLLALVPRQLMFWVRGIVHRAPKFLSDRGTATRLNDPPWVTITNRRHSGRGSSPAHSRTAARARSPLK